MKESLLNINKYGPHGYGWKEVRSIISPAFTTGKMKLVRLSDSKADDFLKSNIVESLQKIIQF
jgi:hypothetical protein